MQEKSVQRSVELDGHLIVENIENGEHVITGSVKLGNYRYNFIGNEIKSIQPDKNNGFPINKESAIKKWNKMKKMLDGNVEEAHYLYDGNKSYCYRIKPNGTIHMSEDVMLADYCDKKYPDKCIYINGVLYFKPKYKIMIKNIPREEVFRDTGIDTDLVGIFNPKQELLRVSYLLPYVTDGMIEELKAYLLSRQIKVDDRRYIITGY